MDIKHHLIFIVEDNEMYSLLLDYTLSNESTCRVMRFTTGEECIRNLDMKPDLVILDLTLPGIDGKETLKHIKYRDPAIPVVILTGNEDIDAARDFVNKGISNYLIKGTDTIPKLVSIIDSTCNKSLVKEKEKSNKVLNGTIFGIVFFIVLSIVVVYMVII
jgi:two-component system, NtrC family, response regulator AtoC